MKSLEDKILPWKSDGMGYLIYNKMSKDVKFQVEGQLLKLDLYNVWQTIWGNVHCKVWEL